MSDMPKVSVIVPMYNPGQMIQRGLNSLRNQTLRDIEIILVDDCSDESTLTEAKAAASEETRIRVLKTEVNSGPGIARNIGIDKAVGEYLAFMDADDFLAPDFLERLYHKATLYHAVIAKGSLIHVTKNGDRTRSQPSSGENGIIRRQLKKGKPLYTLFRSDHYSALYKREWISEHNIHYGTSRYGEDSTFLLRVTADKDNIILDDKACYYRVDHPDSLMTVMTAQRLNEQLLSLREQIDYLVGRFDQNIETDYEMQRIRWTLGVHAAAVRQGDLAKEADVFLTGIRTEVQRLPNLSRLVLYSPMVGALVEYGENLSSLVMRQTEGDREADALIESITRCFRFASLHPDRKDLYEAPLRESLDRAATYLFGKEGIHPKGITAKEKAAFMSRLFSELRMTVDPSFWEKNLKKWLRPGNLMREGKNLLKKVKKR